MCARDSSVWEKFYGRMICGICMAPKSKILEQLVFGLSVCLFLSLGSLENLSIDLLENYHRLQLLNHKGKKTSFYVSELVILK